MDANDVLGKVGPWQIKEFPEALREDITRQAKLERLTVGEFVTGHMAALRDAGWPRGGLPINPTLNHGQPITLTDLGRAIDMACKVAEYGERMPVGMRNIANQLVKGRLAGMKQTEQTIIGKSGKPLAVAAPDEAEKAAETGPHLTLVPRDDRSAIGLLTVANEQTDG